jgi:hypothetical protein
MTAYSEGLRYVTPGANLDRVSICLKLQKFAIDITQVYRRNHQNIWG